MAFQLIGQGMAKSVYIAAVATAAATYVYYTPRFPWTKSTLQQELEMTTRIRDAIQARGLSDRHLALGLSESPEQVNKQYTLRAEKAGGDLEKLIEKTDLQFQSRLDLCAQASHGFSNLHKAGFIHQDIKPDNLLVFENKNLLPFSSKTPILKLNDWGCAKPQEEKTASRIETGNSRFGAPENLASQKGETFSLGLLLIQILEMGFLQSEKMLIETPPFYLPFPKKGKGVIRYITSHPTIFRSYQAHVIKHMICLCMYIKFCLTGVMYSKSERAQRKQKALFTYIDALESRLCSSNSCSKAQAKRVCALLKEMTYWDPSKRPTTTQVYERLSAENRSILSAVVHVALSPIKLIYKTPL